MVTGKCSKFILPCSDQIATLLCLSCWHRVIFQSEIIIDSPVFGKKKRTRRKTTYLSFVWFVVRLIRRSSGSSFVWFGPPDTSNKHGRRTSVDREQAWTENKRGFYKKWLWAVCTTGGLVRKRGLEQGVDSNKAWTRTKRGLERKPPATFAFIFQKLFFDWKKSVFQTGLTWHPS